MDEVFYVHINYVKVQFEAKVVEICTNLVQCCVVVIFIQLDIQKMEWQLSLILHHSTVGAFNAIPSFIYHNLNCEGVYKFHWSILYEEGK